MRLLITLLLCFGASAEALDYGVGLGVDSRVGKDVNPAYTSARSLGQLFGEVRFYPWTIALEYMRDTQTSSDGGLSIQRVSNSLGLWGRFGFLDPDGWSPYATVGLGTYLDRVTSTFAAERDERKGSRAFLGAGAGVAKTFFTYLLTEAEVRGLLVREQKDPGLALILRLGVRF